jgi:hypothetical protein
MKFLKPFLIYTLSCFFLGQICYWIVQVIEFDFSFTSFPFVAFTTFGNQPYGSFYKMPSYHWEYPATYWWVMSFCFGTIAAVWKLVFVNSKKWLRIMTGVSVVPVSVVLASIPASMLWVYHDIQAGRYHGGGGVFEYMLQQIPVGFKLALPLYVISVPFNIITTACALSLLFTKSPFWKITSKLRGK